MTDSDFCTTAICFLRSGSTGKERDAESGLDYFGARFYSSVVGRFMSPDRPVDQHEEDPQSMNLYSYVRNRPLNSVDPTGNYDCTGTAAFCFDVRLAAFNLRVASYDAGAPNSSTLQKISSVLGKDGDHNGVTVTSKDLGGTPNNHADAVTEGKSITFNSRFDESRGEMAANLIHEGTHVLQNERAAALKKSWLGGLVDLSGLFPSKPSWSGSYNLESEAYTNQGYMEQALHMKGTIYDPSDIKPGADERRRSRIDSAARASVNDERECGSGSVGEAHSKCTE